MYIIIIGTCAEAREMYSLSRFDLKRRRHTRIHFITEQQQEQQQQKLLEKSYSLFSFLFSFFGVGLVLNLSSNLCVVVAGAGFAGARVRKRTLMNNVFYSSASLELLPLLFTFPSNSSNTRS